MAPQRTSQPALDAASPFTAPQLRLELGRLLPSGRSLALGFAILTLAVAAYVGARTSSVFAIERIDVRGVPAADRAAASAALRPLAGRSLVALRRTDLERRLAQLPGIQGFEYDRSFPNTLVVRARPERALAVVRRGDESWLVSRRGRVLRQVPRGALAGLARVWVPRRVTVERGATLGDVTGGAAVRAIALFDAAAVPARVRTVRTGRELTYVLRSGLELRLGSPRATRLKLAAAAAILPGLGEGFDYLDVTVPSRPVAGIDPQVEG